MNLCSFSPRTHCFSRVQGSLHLDFDAHPGMDAALKKVLTRRQACDLEFRSAGGGGLTLGGLFRFGARFDPGRKPTNRRSSTNASTSFSKARSATPDRVV